MFISTRSCESALRVMRFAIHLRSKPSFVCNVEMMVTAKDSSVASFRTCSKVAKRMSVSRSTSPTANWTVTSCALINRFEWLGLLRVGLVLTKKLAVLGAPEISLSLIVVNP
jgi:hypothetical protein